jgi:hypothetical protein
METSIEGKKLSGASIAQKTGWEIGMVIGR